MKKTIENKHGGARPGAGRKSIGIETTTITFRVPKNIALLLREKIHVMISKEVAKTK